MCKVSELIEYLQKLPQDATVEVIERVPSLGYGGDDYRWTPLTLEEYSDTAVFTDFTANEYVAANDKHGYYGKRVLFLGDN